MIEALTPVLEKYRSRRDGYLSTASAYKGCHVAKGIELRKLAAVCDMHIRELQAAIEGWQSVPVPEQAKPVRTARRTQARAADSAPPSVRYGEVEGAETGSASEAPAMPYVSADGQDRGSDDL